MPALGPNLPTDLRATIAALLRNRKPDVQRVEHFEQRVDARVALLRKLGRVLDGASESI